MATPHRAVTDRLRPPTAEERADALAVVTHHLPPAPLRATEVPTPGGAVPALLELEVAQPTGAFKVRGALAALASLPDEAHAVSASAGNHALGMAWAANRLGRPVTVVTPATASQSKLAALRRWEAARGSRVTLRTEGATYEQAEAAARRLVEADHAAATYVSSYSDWAVIAGQSTLGAELGGQLPEDGDPLTVVTPLGGGGLASGLCLWAADRPDVTIVAVEPVASPAVGTAVEAGAIVTVEVAATIADGLSGNLEEGSPTPAVIGEAVAAGRARIERVTEDEIRSAMRWLFAAEGLVVEGAGAAGLAAVLAGRAGLAGVMAGRAQPKGKLVVLLTGRNVAPGTYAAVLAERD